MALNWTDVLDIAIELGESKPDVDPRYVNFVELQVKAGAWRRFAVAPRADRLEAALIFLPRTRV